MRSIRVIGRVALTVLVIGGAGALVVAGAGRIAANAEAPVAEAAVVPVDVRVVPLEEQATYRVPARFQGQVEARRRVDLGFEAGGTVAEVLVDEGDRVEAGAVIARLDTRALEAERAAQVAAKAALEAQLELAELTTERQRALAEREFSSAQRYDEARLGAVRLRAEIARAEAGIASVDVALSKAELRAPFAARIGGRMVDEGTRVGGGQALLTLLEDVAPEFRVGLPEALAGNLADELRVEIGVKRYTATVSAVRADINAATRTVPVLLSLDGAAGVADGALGALVLDREVAGPGAWVPVSALSEGVRGLWTLFLIEESDETRVRREAVEVLYADAERAFVRGAFGGARAVVAEGGHRVTDGQLVRPVTGLEG